MSKAKIKKSKPKRFWQKKSIRAVAKKYLTRGEFRNKENGAYAAAIKLGILDSVCSHMKVIQQPPGYWTKKRIVEIAKKYKDRTEFSKKNPKAYQQAYKLKITKEAFAHMPLKIEHGKWSRKKVIKIAKKFKTVMEFKNSEGGAYAFAYKKGFLNEIKKNFNIIRRSENTWTKKEILEISKKYKRRKDFYRGNKKAYRIALNKGWLDEIYSTLKMGKTSSQLRGVYAFEFGNKSVYIGLTNNYNNRYRNHMEKPLFRKLTDKFGLTFVMFNQFYSPHDAGKVEKLKVESYRRNGWEILNKAPAGGLGGYSKVWTLNKLKKITRQYDSLAEFRKNEPRAYSSMKKFKLVKALTKHMPRKTRSWTKSELLKEAKKYKTMREFRLNNRTAYSACQRSGILDEVARYAKRSKLPNNFRKI